MPEPDIVQRWRRAWEDEPGTTYGSVLPFKQDDKGATSWAWPELVRSNVRGGLDLLMGPRTGEVTPEATATLGLLGGVAGAEMAPVGAVASGAARMAKPAFPWRPLEDVAAEAPKAVPEHVLDFGSYMRDMAKKAGGEGLSPRDVIKAFGITRSSIQRGAINADKLRENWPDYQGEGKVRPEGAFSDWLFTPHGQNYLNDAEKGVINAPAVEDAATKLRGFGKDNDLRKALGAAPAIGAQAPEVSRLVAGGYAAPGQGIDEWRGLATGMPGIGPAKSGFVASLLGRGDQPTLDARQVLLQTGGPTAAVKDYLSSPKRAFPVVDELARRQDALGLDMPADLEPFRQHLTHHTLWDAQGGEQTTHADVIRAMRLAASGPKETGLLGMAEGGGGLDLSTEARLARARDMGFDTSAPLYHGTSENFPAFDLGKAGTGVGEANERAVFASPDPRTANAFSTMAGPTPNVLKLYSAAKNPKVVDVNGPPDGAWFSQSIDDARAQGHDAVLFRGVKERHIPRADHVAILDPALLRSAHAAFDPAKAGSGDILAAKGPKGLAAFAAPQPAGPTWEDYLRGGRT